MTKAALCCFLLFCFVTILRFFVTAKLSELMRRVFVAAVLLFKGTNEGSNVGLYERKPWPTIVLSAIFLSRLLPKCSTVNAVADATAAAAYAAANDDEVFV